MKILVALTLLFVIKIVSGEALGGYGADPNKVSVSGISSGACMSTQLHVTYSKSFMGAGIIAGTPYYCAQATIAGATTCMSTPSLEVISALVQETQNTAAFGYADPVSNIQGDKVYIYAGTADTVVNPGNGPNVQQYYNSFGATIQTEFNVDSEHCQPTVNYGNACTTLGSPYISQCNYNAAFTLLDFIYGGLVQPTGTVPLNGDLYLFDQTEFISGTAASISMDTSGYVYVPSGCVTNTGCKLHFAIHGCQQGRDSIGDVYVMNSGYNEVAELNNIIIVYPQVVTSLTLPSNPQGCWDWWGYTSVDYASNLGPQMKAVKGMLDRVLS